MSNIKYDLIVIGAGAAGILASLKASMDNKSVLLLEKLPNIGAKIKATGGGKCNITNTLSNEEFMNRFGKDGKFIRDALYEFDSRALISFLHDINVDTISKDGFRIFPSTHNSASILEAFKEQIKKNNINLLCNQNVISIQSKNNHIISVSTSTNIYKANKFIIATGGLGYPTLGANGDGYKFAKQLGHKISTLNPAMMPLFTKELWTENCTANTIAKVQIKINLPKYKQYKAIGDLIFTKKGIRGPVVLDFAREITPLLEKYKEVPILINLVQGKNEEQIRQYFKKELLKNIHFTILEVLQTLIPQSLIIEILKIIKLDSKIKFTKLTGLQRDNIIKLLISMPLTIIGHDGFKMAMITRGGVSLKEINPKTMKSKLIDNIYFCGEVIDIDGPCGGFNLQWSFSSGYLAGSLKD
jgi:predicted Rossmann fold flavoprotein